MLSTTTILWLAGLTAACGALAWRVGPRLRWAWRVRGLVDPSNDPGAARVSDAASRWARRDDAPSLPLPRAWEVALAESTDEEAWQALATFRHHGVVEGELAVGLTLGHVSGLPWRAWVRELPALEDAASSDARALAAERLVALGRLGEAESLLEAVPADHWRGCRVRAVLYAVRGDLERAASARHAAWSLAPHGARQALALQQEATRLTVR